MNGPDTVVPFEQYTRDKANIHVDDVTLPRRQHTLEALATATARATRVMIEAQRPGYEAVGYRIAVRMGLASVQGIDERQAGAGPDEHARCADPI